MKRAFPLCAILVLATCRIRAGDAFDALVYEASGPAYAALEKQSHAFVDKLRTAPDDDVRAAAADSFLVYLAGVERKLSSTGKPDFAAEVRAYRGAVLDYREDLRAAAEDPLAGDGDDPFAGDSADPFAPPPVPEAAVRPVVKKPAYDPLDPFAVPPEERSKPAGGTPAPPAAAPPEAKPAGRTPAPVAATPAPSPAVAAPAPPATAPAPPPVAAAPAPAARGWLSSPTVVEIDASMPGVGVGPFEEGDLLVLRYKSGEWTSEEKRRFPVKPDVPRVDPRERLVLIEGAETTEVPGHTDAAPFVYTLEGGGEVKLRIGEDPGQDHEHLDDNAGTVTYLAYVIGADEADEFRASTEGRRCQFARTASEKRAEEAARGDPFTLVTSKKEDDWSFDFTQNNGRFTIKVDGTEFGMRWMRGPSEEIVFAGADFVRKIGGKKGFKRLPNTPKAFDDLVFSSGSRTVHRGEVVVFLNAEGRVLGVRVDAIRLPNPRTGSPGKLSIHWHVY